MNSAFLRSRGSVVHKGRVAMDAVASKTGRLLKKGLSVGRKRHPQTPEIRRTMAGRFGARLAELADAAHLDADNLAAKIGKTGDMVRIYYAGRSVPPLNDWPKLAKALGVKVRDLIPE